MDHKNSYRNIFKATSIFGGVQVFNIIVSVIRSKVIAVLLGPAGMGITGLLTSTLALISSVTSFGLGVSSIKDIAAANEVRDNQRVLKIAAVVNKLVYFTGLFGAVLTLVLSPLLSKITFNNYDYTWSFIFLSVTLCLGQLTLGKDAVLQGTRQLKLLAYANMLSSIASLMITLPLYFLYGVNGIVPALIVISCTTLIITQYFYKKLKLKLPTIANKETWIKGKSMLKLGFFLSLSGLITTGFAYLLRIFITRTGSLADVGFYNAGFGIVNTYVGIIFAAMSTDYYPRLAGVINDKRRYVSIVNQQGNVALLILGPILTVFIVFVNIAIIVLYSKAFLPINVMMQYAVIGVFFKAAAWLLGYVVLAKGSTKLFFWCEFSGSLYITILSGVGFYYWGLTGLGVSFVIGYLLSFIQMFFVTKTFYEFHFEPYFVKIFAIQLFIASIALVAVTLIHNPILSYSVGVFLVVCISVYSLFELNKILDLKEIVLKFRKK